MLEQIHYKVSWRKWLLRDLKCELKLASIRDEEKSVHGSRSSINVAQKNESGTEIIFHGRI